MQQVPGSAQLRRSLAGGPPDGYPGGALEVAGCGGETPFFTEIQHVYDELGEGDGSPWPPPRPENQPNPTATDFETSGHFAVIETRRYPWARRYTADEYFALLDTFSSHIAMEPAKREHLYREIRRRVAARPDGRLTRHWSAVLTGGRRS